MLDSDTDVLYIVISVIRELHCVSIWLWLLLCHSCMSGEQKEARCRVGWWEGSCRLGWTFPSPCFNKLCTVLQDYQTYPTTPLSLYRHSFMRESLTTNFTLVIVFFACSEKTLIVYESSLWSKSCPPERLVLPTPRELQLLRAELTAL